MVRMRKLQTWSRYLSQLRHTGTQSLDEGWCLLELADRSHARNSHNRNEDGVESATPLQGHDKCATRGESFVDLPPHWREVFELRRKNALESEALARMQGASDPARLELERDIEEAAGQRKVLEARRDDIRRQADYWFRLLTLYEENSRESTPKLSGTEWSALLLRMTRVGVVCGNVAERGVRELGCASPGVRERILDICCEVARSAGRKDCTCGDETATDAKRDAIAQRAARTWRQPSQNSRVGCGKSITARNDLRDGSVLEAAAWTSQRGPRESLATCRHRHSALHRIR